MSAADRWREALLAWAIPDEILAAAPETPYGFPAELFRRRTENAIQRDPTPTTMRALEALPDRGTVLDVGVGSGATSLPLASRASRITGADESEGMLESFRASARSTGVEAIGVSGSVARRRGRLWLRPTSWSAATSSTTCRTSRRSFAS